MSADFSELTELARDFDSVPEKSGPYIRKAVEVSARKVKDASRSKVQSRKYFRQAASAIDYELVGTQGAGVTVLDAEVGYNKSIDAGKLGNLIEFGAPGASNRLAPGSELQRSLVENQDDFVNGLEKALNDGLRATILGG